VVGRTFGTSPRGATGFNLLLFKQMPSDAHLRRAQVTIERRSWRECVAGSDREHKLFHLDPH